MARCALWLATVMLPLGGCYMAPPAQNYPYGQPGYPAAGYAPSPYGPAAAYPGYGESYGGPGPLVFYGGEWGFYDSGRHWHRAPEGASQHMQERRDAGAELHPNSAPHNDYHPQPGSGHAGERQGGQSAFRPVAAPSAAPPPAAAQPRQDNHERHHECPPGQRC